MSLVNKKGVDISYANGNIDLAKVKNAGYEFVMIRCGYGSDIVSQDDSQFASNVAKAEKLGMPWGVYLFSYACSTADAKSELAHIDRLLKAQAKKGYYPTMPIALDIEPTSYIQNHGGWNKTNLTNVATIVLDGLASLGYYPMIYTGYSELDDMLSNHIRNDYDCWFAQWYTSPSEYKYKRLGIWQYGGETNYIDGNSITGVGIIDKNKCYKDYPSIIKNGGYNGFSKNSSSSTSTTTPSTSTSTTTTSTTITEAQLRQKVANQANTWIGAKEGDSTHAEILRIYNSQSPLPVGYKMQTHDAWCAAFVSAVWLKVGIAKYITTECGCGRFRDNAMKLGIWVENDAYKPKVGDAIIYYWSDSGSGDCQTGADHIGLVTAVNGNSFTVTEGNTGNSEVAKRTMQVNGRYIRGFITPDYATIAKKVGGTIKPDSGSSSNSSSSSSSSSSTGSSAIKEVQTWCNNNYNTGIAVDGIYGPKTKTALVKALQTELNRQAGANLVVDGIYGNLTNAAVLIVQKGAQGNITKTLQGLLICNGYSTNGFDGIFGNGTYNAVKLYQAKKGLVADGIAGKNTFSALCK